jgi:hypothetical protein
LQHKGILRNIGANKHKKTDAPVTAHLFYIFSAGKYKSKVAAYLLAAPQ